MSLSASDLPPILQVLGARGEGGAETYFVTLAQAFAQAGQAQRFVVRNNKVRCAQLAPLGPVRTAPFRSFLDFSTSRIIADSARRAGAEIVLAWMSRAARAVPAGPWARIGRLGGYYPLKNFAGFDHLVANAPDVLDFICAQGWPRARVHLIPNAARVFADVRAEPRSAHATPSGVPLLLGIGRLHPNKAHDVSLRALVSIPEAYLWIAGAGEEREKLEMLASELGVLPRVRFLGWRNDMGALMAASDLCIFPSRAEPMGNVVIECWANGLPIVAARAEGPGKLIRHGIDGALVPVDDPDALAEHVRAALAAPQTRADWVKAGKARIDADYSQAAILAQWQTLFARARAERA